MTNAYLFYRGTPEEEESNHTDARSRICMGLFVVCLDAWNGNIYSSETAFAGTELLNKLSKSGFQIFFLLLVLKKHSLVILAGGRKQTNNNKKKLGPHVCTVGL